MLNCGRETARKLFGLFTLFWFAAASINFHGGVQKTRGEICCYWKSQQLYRWRLLPAEQMASEGCRANCCIPSETVLCNKLVPAVSWQRKKSCGMWERGMHLLWVFQGTCTSVGGDAQIWQLQLGLLLHRKKCQITDAHSETLCCNLVKRSSATMLQTVLETVRLVSPEPHSWSFVLLTLWRKWILNI